MSPIHVEVVYALPFRQDCSEIELEAGATVEGAIEQSGVLRRNPEIDPASLWVGIWGRRAQLSDRLRDGDRVEIYRPLVADPKELRRRRVGKKAEKG
ncbi:MAG TPA: RnfH family protein [Burkholderiales bacterium]|nr:RnfH family protein [Burkholderiales bacterium]